VVEVVVVVVVVVVDSPLGTLIPFPPPPPPTLTLTLTLTLQIEDLKLSQQAATLYGGRWAKENGRQTLESIISEQHAALVGK